MHVFAETLHVDFTVIILQAIILCRKAEELGLTRDGRASAVAFG